MSFKVVCPLGHVLRIRDDRAGTWIRCPACGQALYAAPEGSPPPAGDAATVVEYEFLPEEPEPQRQKLSFRAAPARIRKVHRLAMLLALATVLSLLPVLSHWRLSIAPDWARLVWLVAALQLAYVIWLALLPDWSTLWALMFVFAVSAALYGMGMALALTTRESELDSMPLEMADIRHLATGWCCLVMVAFTAMAFLCGRMSHRWSRAPVLIVRTAEA